MIVRASGQRLLETDGGAGAGQRPWSSWSRLRYGHCPLRGEDDFPSKYVSQIGLCDVADSVVGFLTEADVKLSPRCAGNLIFCNESNGPLDSGCLRDLVT